MARSDRRTSTHSQAFDADLEHEIDLFAERARRENTLEAVMRVRALIEISGQLDTEKLLALALWLTGQKAPRNEPGEPPPTLM